jgi:hypothetical protein
MRNSRGSLGPGGPGWTWNWGTVLFWVVLCWLFLGVYVAGAVGVSLGLYLMQGRGWRVKKRRY